MTSRYPKPITGGHLHMGVDGEGITRLVREAYWYEQRKPWALQVLRCFEGITDTQIHAVLNGLGQLRNNKKGEVFFELHNETMFQQEILDLQAWREANCVMFGDRWVSRHAWATYARQVVRRLRSTAFLTHVSLETIQELEETRQRLHDQLVKEAGFRERSLNEEGYSDFSEALTCELDRQAGLAFSDLDVKEAS